MTTVLHVVHWPKTGITRLLETLFADIHAQVDLHVFVLEAAEDQVDEFRKVTKSVTVGGVGGNPLTRLTKLKSVVQSVKPDIIHTHSFTPSLLAALFFPSARHIRTVHSAYPYFSGTALRDRLKSFFEFKLLDSERMSIICVAEGVKSALPRNFLKARIVTIENGVNCANIKRLSGSRTEHSKDKLLICSVGRLEHQKGYDLLIEACRLLPQTARDNIKLVIAGAGSQEAALRRQIEDGNLGEVVTLAGYMDNPYPLIAAADICVFSSRYEGFSIAAAEAMALGCPVVTTRVSGIPQKLTNGVDAILTDETSAPSLRKAMLVLIGDAELRAKIGARGKCLAEEQFDISIASKKYLAMYAASGNPS